MAILKKMWEAALYLFGFVVIVVLMATGAYFALGLHNRKKEKKDDATVDVRNPDAGPDADHARVIRDAAERLLRKTGHG
ncbi:MAG TPA: hypothetical protein PKM65_20415 [Spirochaetota bacterium]|nr:hypothetical protein [Spirochaetota bacterium]